MEIRPSPRSVRRTRAGRIAIEVYFEAFLALLFPEVHAGIDWSRGYEFLDKELQQVTREAELGSRVVDKLARVHCKDGAEAWVLVHVEVQGQHDRDFEQRMVVYNYRLFDRHGRRVVSLAVLADGRRGWRPSSFGYTLWGCQVSLRFPAVKLLDLGKHREELEQSPSPFAVLVMAHLDAQRTHGDNPGRLQAKLGLVRELHRRGLGEREVRQLSRFVDWLLALPEELDDDFWREAKALEEEKKMPYVTSIERIGIKEGLKQGRRQAIALVRQALEIRFGDEGLALAPELDALEPEALSQLHERLLRGATIDEVREAIRAGRR